MGGGRLGFWTTLVGHPGRPHWNRRRRRRKKRGTSGRRKMMMMKLLAFSWEGSTPWRDWWVWGQCTEVGFEGWRET